MSSSVELASRTEPFRFVAVINAIAELGWDRLSEADGIDVAWAYYYFSVQFRENLEIARDLYPDDDKLSSLVREECDTDNLSPWPGVAASGEKMNHDDFMQRLLALSPIPDDVRQRYEAEGQTYLAGVRAMDPITRALSIASYEDGGLETVFRAILRSPGYSNPLVAAFRHFLSEHIRFDSDAEGGHGAMIRHLRPDDRILPLWASFRDLLVEFAPSLAA